MSPFIFTIGNFSVRWYSILILTSVFISYFMILYEGQKLNYNRDFLFNLLFWMIIIGIICARIYYVIFSLDKFDGFIDMLKIWEGGIAINGAMIGGVIVLILYCKKNNVPILKTLDIIVPALILSQAISRWGNFFNHEAYGSIVSYHTLVDLKIIPQFVIDNMEINGAYRLPMFYFESLWCIIGFILLLIKRGFKYTKNGQVFALYLMWYGIGRFVIEIFRADSLMFGNMKMACFVSAGMFLTGLVISICQAKKPKLECLYSEAIADN